MATNIDLSYTQNVFTCVELDKTKRKVTISIITRPVQMGKKNLEECILPNGTIFKHWGVMVEFEETDDLSSSVYVFDADVAIESKKPDNLLTDTWELISTLMKGEFLVTAFAYGPNKEHKKHPHQEHITKLDSPQIVGEISPYELVQTVRRCANKFKSNSYNFVFNNCQEFANRLLEEIEISLTNITQPSSGAKWTSGNVSTATGIALGAVAVGGLIFRALSTEKKETSAQQSNTN